MPQYLLSVWHDADYELDFSTPDAQRQAAQVGAFNEELQRSGSWVFAAGLHPASSATVVRASGGGGVSMTDGPYAETKEQMGGFWIVEAADLDAALQLAGRAAAACERPVEMRPVHG
ncbi:MAG TPA: YciI family protein [Acidimicrobiales bacterium]|nr:YciI family protein [Acidimicrobiales bacterium]